MEELPFNHFSANKDEMLNKMRKDKLTAKALGAILFMLQLQNLDLITGHTTLHSHLTLHIPTGLYTCYPTSQPTSQPAEKRVFYLKGQGQIPVTQTPPTCKAGLLKITVHTQDVSQQRK